MRIALFTETYLPYISGVVTHVKLLKEVLHFEKEINSTNEIEEVYQKFQEEVDASQRSESKDKIGEIIRDEEELENSEKVDER